MQQNANTTGQTFQLELVSPEAVLSSEPVTFAVLPASEGAIGVLPGHAPLLTTMAPGVIEIHNANDNEPRRVFVTGGFLDISETQCTALAVEAVELSEISLDEAQKRYQELLEKIGLEVDKAKRLNLERALLIEKTKIEALTGKIIA